ncbi:MAG: universal stress protein [Desulfuromusa sp.]
MIKKSELDNKSLLLCIDLEKGSDQLVKYAAQHARRCKLTTQVLYVSHSELDKTTRGKILTQLHNLIDQPFSDLPIETIKIETGMIEEIIVKTARHDRVALILLGRRQRSKVERIHIGSTTRAVIALACRPVLVVPVDHSTEGGF